jgi:hypothetical protein
MRKGSWSPRIDPHWGGASEGFKGTKYRRSLSEKSQEPTIDKYK